MQRRRKWLALCSLVLVGSAAGAAPSTGPVCGTQRDLDAQQLYLHARVNRARGVNRAQRIRALAASAAATSYDSGNVAVMDGSEGVLTVPNAFNLDGKTLVFTPATPDASRYKATVAAASYQVADAQSGVRLDGLGDDDTRQVTLPFAFPYFGLTYRTVWVNSDGNLTFVSGDGDATDRSAGRFAGGPPRLAPLFTDLDPSSARGLNGVKVLASASRVVISWQGVPLYSDVSPGREQSFQVRLFPDGRVEFAYGGAAPSDAVTGISPGGLKSAVSFVPFADGTAVDVAGPVADVFSSSTSLDIAAAAQKFYATHEDAYDYLVFYNSAGVQAGPTALAYEVTVRNDRTGYGDKPKALGEQFGSGRRLQAVLNLGSLSQYPDDPNAAVPLRGPTGDTPLSIIGHEAGHLFLAFTSVTDPNSMSTLPMLGRALVHWAFTFNSEASLLEGNRLMDNGASASPRFRTTATVEGYSPLDQYLMGLRAPEEVPPTFVVTQASTAVARAPQVGITFNGVRLDVRVEDVIAAAGRRTPDYTVAQRRFRFAFVLVTGAGQTAAPQHLAKVELLRSRFVDYFSKATSGRAVADTALTHAVQLSAAPAAGVLVGKQAVVNITLSAPPAADVAFGVASGNGFLSVPATVTIPAGAPKASFTMTGVREGVDDLIVTPQDASYETTAARIAVRPALPSSVTLELVSADRIAGAPGVPIGQPIQVRVVDMNRLPYPGLAVDASVTDGKLDATAAVTDEKGIASFRWTPGSAAGGFTASIFQGAQTVKVTLTPRPTALTNGIGNAASGALELCPGGFAVVYGSSLTTGASAAAALPFPYQLAGTQVWVNGIAAQLTYAAPGQINFIVPPGTSGDTARVEIVNGTGTSEAYVLPVRALSPGVFVSAANNAGAVVVSGNRSITFDVPAAPGDYIEIYGTGFGATIASSRYQGLDETVAAPRVTIGGVEAEVVVSVASPGVPGLYQINARVPDSTPKGDQPLTISFGSTRSNAVLVRIR